MKIKIKNIIYKYEICIHNSNKTVIMVLKLDTINDERLRNKKSL